MYLGCFRNRNHDTICSHIKKASMENFSGTLIFRLCYSNRDNIHLCDDAFNSVYVAAARPWKLSPHTWKVNLPTFAAETIIPKPPTNECVWFFYLLLFMRSVMIKMISSHFSISLVYNEQREHSENCEKLKLLKSSLRNMLN